MIDPAHLSSHPDGFTYGDELPGPPSVPPSWLDGDDVYDDEWDSGFRPHLEDPA